MWQYYIKYYQSNNTNFNYYVNEIIKVFFQIKFLKKNSDQKIIIYLLIRINNFVLTILFLLNKFFKVSRLYEVC